MQIGVVRSAGERIARTLGGPMGRTRTPRVLVLYVHPLLGQGLARLLVAQAGVSAVAVSVLDDAARSAALSRRPDLVIAEESGETPASLPVVFVRVDTEDGGHLGQPLTDPDLIVALARGLAAVPLDSLTQRRGRAAITSVGAARAR